MMDPTHGSTPLMTTDVVARETPFVRVIAIVLLAFALLLVPSRGRAQDYCGMANNLTANCGMDSFTSHTGDGTRIVATGWGYFVTAGSAAFDDSVDSFAPPSQRIWSDGDIFTAGLYQQIAVTPGTTYRGGVIWAPYTAPDGTMMRQVGFDPTGGTNPDSPTVQWGAENWSFSRLTFLESSAVATGNVMTMFVRVRLPANSGQDQIFLDGLWMQADGSAPPVAPTVTPAPPTATLQPTATAVPPTMTATVPPTTATPIVTPTRPALSATPTNGATAVPSTATARPRSSATPTRRATASPRPTRRATATRRPAPSPTTTASAVPPTATANGAIAVAPAATAPPSPTATLVATEQGAEGNGWWLWALVGAGLAAAGVAALWWRRR